MTLTSYILGAAVGLGVGAVGSRLGLPFALKAQEAQARKGKIKDPERTRRSTELMYRYVFPVVFAVVFALTAHQIFDGG
jgi:hypothetical protein